MVRNRTGIHLGFIYRRYGTKRLRYRFRNRYLSTGGHGGGHSRLKYDFWKFEQEKELSVSKNFLGISVLGLLGSIFRGELAVSVKTLICDFPDSLIGILEDLKKRCAGALCGGETLLLD